MAQNDIIVPREGANNVLTEIVLADATTSARGLLSASDKTKLDGIAAGAEVNVNADWNASSGDAQILNKPTLGTAAAAATTDFAAASHTHAASAITSGVFDNARINFAAPPAIGNTTPAAGSFSTLNATGTTELVNGGTTAGPFRLYNISSAANANFERLSLRWASSVAIIGTEKAGTGSARPLEFQTDGVTRMTIADTGAVTMSDNNTMVFRTSATKFTTLSTNANGGGLTLTYTSDLGTQNADYGIFVAGGPLRVTGTDGFGSSIRTTGRISCGSVIQCTQIGSVQDGNHGWTFAAAMTASSSVTSVTVPFLRLAGATNQFPALKRSSTTLQVRLADDTAFAPFECAGLTLNGNLTASTRDIVTDTTTGTRIGTGTTQLLGFWNAAPSAQPAAVADATDAATVITQLNALLSRLRTIGIIAT